MIYWNYRYSHHQETQDTQAVSADLHCFSDTQSMYVDEDSRQNIRAFVPLDSCALIKVFTLYFRPLVKAA